MIVMKVCSVLWKITPKMKPVLNKRVLLLGLYLLREDFQNQGRSERAHEEEGPQEDQPQERRLRQVGVL